MSGTELRVLMPLILLALTSITTMLAISIHRDHRLALFITLTGLVSSLAAGFFMQGIIPRAITPLLLFDHFALFMMSLVVLAGAIVSCLAYSYLEMHSGHKEEFYLLLVIAVLGCVVLTCAVHFTSMFLGIELLGVSLYGLVAYLRHHEHSVEAGVKYLILAAIASAFILFGMSLVYAMTGTMALHDVIPRSIALHGDRLTILAGFSLIIVGLGFKLAVVPFHLWTPDVYEGSPPPVTAFIATASKGAVFALLFRMIAIIDIHACAPLGAIISAVAVSSMFVGNLLALFQSDIKRLLAYSSISHLGYLLITLLASGPLAVSAAAFYLAAYFITTLGAFGVVTVLSTSDGDAGSLEKYRGLAWQRPWLSSVLIVMLFSLAGLPLTVGFMGKFYILSAGIGSLQWFLVIALIINSVIGLSYYLRIIIVLFSNRDQAERTEPRMSPLGIAVLASLMVLVIGLGVYPAPLISLLEMATQGKFG